MLYNNEREPLSRVFQTHVVQKRVTSLVLQRRVAQINRQNTQLNVIREQTKCYESNVVTAFCKLEKALRYDVKGKGKVVPVLNQVPYHEEKEPLVLIG
jgi:hypothetical protein